MGWDGVMDDLLGGSKPGFHLGGVKIRTKPAEGILAAQSRPLCMPVILATASSS